MKRYRGKEKFYALFLVILLVASLIPGFAPWTMKAVSAQPLSYPTNIEITAYYTSYNCTGNYSLFQGYPYWIQFEIRYVNSTGGVTAVYSNVLCQN